MRYIRVLDLAIGIVIASTLFCCKEQNPPKKLSRLEQVKKVPFRSLKVPDSLNYELVETSKYLWNLIKKPAIEDGLVVLWDKETHGLVIVDIKKESLNAMRHDSYELWKNGDVVLSALLYKSGSVDAITSEEKEFYVIEFEHKKLTGTFYVSIPIDGSKFSTNYVDRN